MHQSHGGNHNLYMHQDEAKDQPQHCCVTKFVAEEFLFGYAIEKHPTEAAMSENNSDNSCQECFFELLPRELQDRIRIMANCSGWAPVCMPIIAMNAWRPTSSAQEPNQIVILVWKSQGLNNPRLHAR